MLISLVATSRQLFKVRPRFHAIIRVKFKFLLASREFEFGPFSRDSAAKWTADYG
jgi:hypothetical protein